MPCGPRNSSSSSILARIRRSRSSSNMAKSTGPLVRVGLPALFRQRGRQRRVLGQEARWRSATSSGKSDRDASLMTVAATSGISPTTERTFIGIELPSGRRSTS